MTMPAGLIRAWLQEDKVPGSNIPRESTICQPKLFNVWTRFLRVPSDGTHLSTELDSARKYSPGDRGKDMGSRNLETRS